MSLARTIVIIVLALLLSLSPLATSPYAVLAAPTDITLQEIPMTAGGYLGEIMPDTQGNLWVSDYGANEIVRIDPAANTQTRYSDLAGGVVVAQRGPENLIWYNGYDDASVGRLSLTNNSVITWTIPGSVHPFGLAVLENGDVWIAEYDVAKIYRFRPATTQLCTYTLPNDSKSIYLFPTDEGIWLADYITDDLLLLDPATGEMEAWPIFESVASEANPYDLAFDAAGNVWWADGGLGAIGHLDRTAREVTLYRDDQISSPNYLALDGDQVWFVDPFFQQFSLFNPDQALPTTYPLTPTTISLSAPACANLGAGNNSTATVQSSSISFADTTAPNPVKIACGWVAQKGPTGGQLYDIAIANDRIWITDHERDRLVATPDIYTDLAAAECYSTYSYLPSLQKE